MGMPHWMSEKLGVHHLFSEFVTPVIYAPKEFILSHTFDFSLLIGTIVVLAAVYYFTRKMYVTEKVVPEEDSETKSFQKVLANKYYVDEIYDTVIRKPLDAISEMFYKIFDINIIDGIVNGIPKATNITASVARMLQTGRLGIYLVVMVIGVICLFAFKLLL